MLCAGYFDKNKIADLGYKYSFTLSGSNFLFSPVQWLINIPLCQFYTEDDVITI